MLLLSAYIEQLLLYPLARDHAIPSFHFYYCITYETAMGSIPETEKTSRPDIIDIRSDAAGIELKQLIHEGLNAEDGTNEKTLPTLLLYDNKGLKLFEQITYLEEYYLTGEEIEVLEKHADRIAERIPNNALIVELGSG